LRARQNCVAPANPDGFLLTSPNDYNSGLGVLMLKRNSDKVVTSGNLTSIDLSQPTASVKVDRLDIQRAQSAVLVEKDGVHVTLLAPGPVRTELPDVSEQSLVERLIPDFLWFDTEYTAKVYLGALRATKVVIVPGLSSTAIVGASDCCVVDVGRGDGSCGPHDGVPGRTGERRRATGSRRGACPRAVAGRGPGVRP